MNQYEVGLACLEKYVLPILDKPNEFINYISSLLKISETLFLYGCDNELTKFKDLVLANLNQNQIQKLLEKYIKRKNENRLHVCKQIIDLFNFRINFLKQNLPVNDWKMNGRVSSQEVTEFLKSNRQEMTYRGGDESLGHFYSIVQARKFASVYSGFNRDYSIQIEAFKIKKDKPFVTITKTLEYFNAILRKFNENINNLELFLKN